MEIPKKQFRIFCYFALGAFAIFSIRIDTRVKVEEAWLRAHMAADMARMDTVFSRHEAERQQDRKALNDELQNDIAEQNARSKAFADRLRERSAARLAKVEAWAKESIESLQENR